MSDNCGICKKGNIDHKNGAIVWGTPVHNSCLDKNIKKGGK